MPVFVQNVPAFEVQVGIEKGSKEIEFNPQISLKEWIGHLHQQWPEDIDNGRQ